MSQSVRSDLSIIRRLIHQARAYRLQIIGILLLDVLSAPLALLTPIPIKIAVDSVLGTQPLPGVLSAMLPEVVLSSTAAMLMFCGVLIVLIAFAQHLQGLTGWILQTSVGERLTLGFRAVLFRHIQRLSLSYHDAKGASDAIFRIQYDAPAIQWIIIHGLIPFVTAGALLAGMITVTMGIDSELGIVALAIVPVLLILTQASRKRLRHRWSDVKESQSSAMSVIQESLTAARVVKAFGQEDREHDRFLGHAKRGVHGYMQVAFLEGGFGLLIGLTVAIGMASVLVIGVQHVQQGTLLLGDLLLVLAYLTQLYGPLETMSKRIASVQSSIVGAERSFEILDLAVEVAERPDARHLHRTSGGIEFRNVSFSYDGKQMALRNASFRVPPGARVGIAGKTGAGKTTLVSLLPRFYDPKEGAILLDGLDLREYRLTDLRNQFAIVLQEPLLFSTTLAENIAYGRPGATDAEIEAAARAAHADEFIRALPDGYKTQVGDRGMLLSGGERQRISLARAFLKDAPILILDEPTSSVDMKTEGMIMEAMERLMSGRTTFLIAHRLKTLDGCSIRLEIQDGSLQVMTTNAIAQ